jgi:2'-5' RNA ligase superfamily protein
MRATNAFGYAFVIAVPPRANRELRRWTAVTPGASWDASGGHITLARFTGHLQPEALASAFLAVCAGLEAFDVRLCTPRRAPYWDKPGLDIVMLTGAEPDDTAGVRGLRERLLGAMLPLGVRLMEGGDAYLPHITLTTGLPSDEAKALERAATQLELRFTAQEVVYWSGGEAAEDHAPADPPWHVVERIVLSPKGSTRAG